MGNKKIIPTIVLGLIITAAGFFLVMKALDKKTSTSTKIPISKQIQTASPTPLITKIPIHKIIMAQFADVIIDENGITPTALTIKKDSLIHFINKTSQQAEIVSEGKLVIETAPIPAGKTVVSLPLFKTGIYSYTLKRNSLIKGTVRVEQ